jgi:hypothetical protein
MQPGKNKLLTIVARLLVIALLLLPILAYVATFGVHVSADHQRWSEMGSAMAGLYTPIFSLLTLLVLVMQVRLQGQINTHQKDQDFVAQAKSDIEFYLAKLDDALQMDLDNAQPIRMALVDTFAHATSQELRSAQFLAAAKALDQHHPRLCSMWMAFYSRLAGLKVHSHHPYGLAYISAKQKATSLLSYEVCAALDNLVHCRTEGRLSHSCEFGAESGEA